MSETLKISATTTANPEGMKLNLGNSANSTSTLPEVAPQAQTPEVAFAEPQEHNPNPDHFMEQAYSAYQANVLGRNDTPLSLEDWAKTRAAQPAPAPERRFAGTPNPELTGELKAIIERSNGEMEDGWDVVGRFNQAGGTVVEVSKPTEDGRFLTRTFPAEKFDSWQPKPEATAPIPETPAPVATSSPEDFQRITQEAKEYFDHFEDPQDIAGLRQDLARHLGQVRGEMWTQFKELGLLPEAGSDLSGQQAANKLVLEKIAQAVEIAKAKKIAELSESSLPYEDDSRKERKQVDRSRESLVKLLNMPAEEFSRLQQDWQRHEMDELHAGALQEDKQYKVGEQRRAAKGEIEALDQKYGGVLGEISRLPLDRQPGSATFLALDGHLQRQQKINGITSELADKDTLGAASLAQGVQELQAGLKAKYQAEGLSEEQIQTKLAESAPTLEAWLQHINGEGLPLADLERYDNQSSKEKMLTQRRRKAGEYIGSTLLLQSLRGALSREKSPDHQPQINAGEIFERGIDHNDSRTKAGAEALQDPEKAASYGGRVMAQLETARNLSRNEGTLMRSLVYMTAVERSLGDGFITAWEAIPEEKKKQARKKLMLGMAVTSSTLKKLSARAAAKARKAAATGAAAGTIWWEQAGRPKL